MKKETIDKLLLKAQQICKQRSVRLTPQRTTVLHLMAQQKKAISAYDLLKLLRNSSEPQAEPPTVYRALDFLLEQGFIHKVESNNSYVMCYHFDHLSHTSVLLICEHCGNVDEHVVEGIESLLSSVANTTGFKLKNIVAEAHGLCKFCQNNLVKTIMS